MALKPCTWKTILEQRMLGDRQWIAGAEASPWRQLDATLGEHTSVGRLLGVDRQIGRQALAEESS